MNMRNLVSLLTALLLLTAGMALAQQTTTLTLLEDCHVNNATQNLNSSFPISDNIMSRNITTGDFGRGFLKFDSSTIAALSGETIQSATLRVLVTEVGAEGVIELYNIVEPWADDTTTWNDQPALSPTPIATRQIQTSDLNQLIEIDITSAVQAWVDGTTTYGVAILPSNSDSVRMKIQSMDNQGSTPAVIAVQTQEQSPSASGEAYIPAFLTFTSSATWMQSLDLAITNITDTPVTVSVLLYGATGEMYEYADIVKALRNISSYDAGSGANPEYTIRFTVQPKNVGMVYLRIDSNSWGHGLIRWEQESSNTKAITATAVNYTGYSGVEGTSHASHVIPVNTGMPF
jgi:hypothetical protein